MCGRFSQYSPVSDLVSLFGVDETVVDDDDRRPRYNVAPTQQVLIVASSADGEARKLGSMRWGLVPRWAKEPSIGNRMINARTDKVATSNAYRSAFAKRRCLVPVDGFYEWAKPAEAAAGSKPPKTPFHIHSPDRTPLGLAGLWETWYDAEDRPMRSFTILTCDANEAMAPIHHRMPVIVDPADWEQWLAPVPLNDADQVRLLAPARDDLLVFDEVATLVNRPANDSAEVIVPV
ncbi:MAG TPA: SOS response-associated peptidase [Acidimicrobiales bacterium]|nr:SOS response-associated peptidase [Acidimicrobiales bacterium]